MVDMGMARRKPRASQVVPYPLSHLDSSSSQLDPVLDAYSDLKFAQRMQLGYTSQGSIWARVCLGAGTQPVKERLTSFWNTTSLVSALLMTFTFATASNPGVRSEGMAVDSLEAYAVEVANVTGIVSFVMSLFCLMFNIVFHEIDYCTNERDERDFLMGFANMFDAVSGLFAGSVVMLLVSVLANVFAFHPRRTFWIIIGLCALFVLWLFLPVALPITVYTRFRLWVRLEGKQLLAEGATGGGGGGGGRQGTTSPDSSSSSRQRQGQRAAAGDAAAVAAKGLGAAGGVRGSSNLEG